LRSCLAQRHDSGAKQAAALNDEMNARTAAIDREFMTWTENLVSENLKRVAALESTVPPPITVDSAVLNQVRDLEEKIRRREATRDAEITDAQKRAQDLRTSQTAEVAVPSSSRHQRNHMTKSCSAKLRAWPP
jgi:hypothetical protein